MENGEGGDDVEDEEEGGDDGEDVNLGLVVSLFPEPEECGDLKVPVDLEQPLGATLSPNAWIQVLRPGGQLLRGGAEVGQRVIRIESKHEWACLATTKDLKGAVVDIRGRGDENVEVVCSSSLRGELKWSGGCLCPADGNIYGIPANAREVLCIDPQAHTATTFGQLSALDDVYGDVDDRWCGGAMGKNGKIYGVPFNGTRVLEIDPATKVCAPFGDSILMGRGKWRGAAVDQYGRLHCIPFQANCMLRIDPKTKGWKTYGEFASLGARKFSGGVFNPHDERVWCVPFDAHSVLTVDPEFGTSAEQFRGELPEGHARGKWSGGVMAPNGSIYCIPFNARRVLRIDTRARKASALDGEFPGFGKWSGGVLANDGCIYGVPHSAGSVLRIDPATGEATAVAQVPTEPTGSGQTLKWRGGVLANNGDVYAIPCDARRALLMHTQDLANQIKMREAQEQRD